MGNKGKSTRDVAGNAMASQAAYAREMVAAGEALGQFERALDLYFEDNIMVTSVVVRVPSADQAEYLLVIKAQQEGRGVVAFHGAGSFREVVSGLVRRMINKTLKWKEDQYAE